MRGRVYIGGDEGYGVWRTETTKLEINEVI
jgi:hypothetical protein